MKKVILVFMMVLVTLGMFACSKKTVTLSCDGEVNGVKCSNFVEVEYTDNKEPDESWVVFCKTCAEKTLAD